MNYVGRGIEEGAEHACSEPLDVFATCVCRYHAYNNYRII